MSVSDGLLSEPPPFDVWIAFRNDGVGGSGTLNDPYNGSTQARFDAVMNLFANLSPEKGITIHLGPGVFETAGFCDDLSGGWQVRPNMKIVGSSMENTTLKLVFPTISNGKQYFAVGHKLSKTIDSKLVANPVDYFEISDLTISANFHALHLLSRKTRKSHGHLFPRPLEM